MEKRYRPLCFALICAAVLLASCAQGGGLGGAPEPQPEPQPVPSSEAAKLIDKGNIVMKDGNRWLITAYVEKDGGSFIDAYSLTVDEHTELITSEGETISAEDAGVGAQVEAWASGPIAESYPMQGRAAKIVLQQEDEIPAEGFVGRTAAVQAALQSQTGATAARAVKDAAADTENAVWSVVLASYEAVEQPVDVRIDGRSGQVIAAENDAFRLFSPQPETEAGPGFTVEGAARVFEAAFSWQLEDGHDILAEGHETADGGAPAWGRFRFEVNYEKASQPNLSLILFVYSAKDGSVEKQLMIPLKAPDDVVDYGMNVSSE
ncbi:Gmad2 immunoglobulin-like domain-containing protein [Paenibacillus thermotolerans]|uniref:Gmad2 immunoglobulin-like domain-containing protein n=1 Tax=Paenibacillus thermotolerans TaxID=3027807 RepID=UPI002368A332|nr:MULTISPECIES: Gmad2 immunoglobulin-like domain-containing protein [unclassified Paenibacillus]